MIKLKKDKKLKLFRYSGNKTTFPLVDLTEYDRIVEPFAGSMGFSLQYDLPALGMDKSSELINLLNWLKSATNNDLEKLRKYEGSKINIRTIKELSDEEKTYLRINIASAVVGQLSSWTIYPQHKLPIEATKLAIQKIRNWKFKNDDYQNYVSKKGDFLFIDPPYLGTSGNYNENSLNMKDFLKWEEALIVPHIITYSEPIEETNSEWICWLTKKVPNIRQGGSKTRKDYYTYITP